MGSCCGMSADAKAALAAAAAGEATAGARLFQRIESLCARLESWPALVASGVALVASFILNGHGCHAHGGGALRLLDPAWIPLVVCGLPVLKEAVLALALERRIRAALLIATAMVACVAIGQLFAAGEVAFIMALGEKLEAWTVGRAKKGLRQLVSLVPPVARRVVTCPKCRARGEFFREVPVAEIAVGDGVMVKPGETIPVDGVVTEGATTVDESVMTGESLPVDKAVGDAVYSGTVNRFGAITLTVTKAGADSSLQKLIRLVREAESKKAPMQRIADRWAGILVPCSMTIAILTFLGGWLVLGDVHAALIRGVTILVVFCPCALVLATPTSIMAAIGQATKFGVIVKSGEALERMGAVETVCFDKTGTLTEGRLSVVHATSARVQALAAAVEAKSEHPVAKAICGSHKPEGLVTQDGGAANHEGLVTQDGGAANHEGLVTQDGGAANREGLVTQDAADVKDFEMKPGRGVRGTVGGKRVACGTEAWLAENGATVDAAVRAEARRLRGEGKAVVLVAEAGACIGLVALADTVRDSARAALADLRRAGVATCLLTGDHRTTAAQVARSLGMDDVRAELLPAEKAAVIDNLQRGGAHVCMVGDGVNDAVALTTAHVGVAMGGAGSDIAVEAADIALVGDDLTKIAYLKRLSSACVRLIKLNIAISMTINACAITLSVLGVLGPVSGALVHNFGSVLVVLNGALLYDRKFR